MMKKYDNEDLKTVVEHQTHRRQRSTDEVINGSMAPDLDEMRRLGKDMDGMKTNKTLKEEGLQPDPVQHDDEE